MNQVRRRDLVAEVSAVLQRYPTLQRIYGPTWVSQHVPAALKRGPHPMLNWLSVPSEYGTAPEGSAERELYDQSEAALTTMSETIDALLQLGAQAGKVKSRLGLLRGKATATWDDNHRDWWTTLCELYVAHWLHSLGYGICLGGKGADIELTERDRSFFVEVTTLRKGLGVEELAGVISWADSYPYHVSVRYTSEDFALNGREIPDLLADLDRACSSLALGRAAERVLKLKSWTGQCEIRLSSHVSPAVSLVGPTNSLAFRFNLLHDQMLEKIRQKVSNKQLLLTRPSVLVIDIQTWRPSAVHQFWLLGNAVMADFPVDDMPREIVALIITTMSPVSVRPSKLTVTRNPNSPFNNDRRLEAFLARIQRVPLSSS